MASASANTADDVSSEVSCFRTVVFAMANSTAVLADLVFVVAECTVEGSEFTKLIAFMIVLTFRSRGRLERVC